MGPHPVIAPTAARRWWLFMRVSGVVLAILVLGHILDTDVIHDLADVDAAFYARRWRNPFWRAWDGALFGLAIWHGAHGARTVVEDFVRGPGARLLAVTVVWGVAALASLLAAIAVLGT